MKYYTNEDIMRLPELPEHLVILGSGFIATEFAHVFSALGSRVSIIGRSGRLLRHLDDEISERFTELAVKKWDVHLGSPVRSVRNEDENVAVELANGTVVSGDVLLVAVGRKPNGDLLDLDKAGIELDDNGSIVVDEYQRTTAEGVFALGDVSSPISSSTWPTTKHASFSTTCSRTRGTTLRGCEPPITGSSRLRCSPIRRSPMSE